ncbi:MAG: PAS domain S-box-containing protein [Salibacteraceae bacterium]|jgi:PAS domain S-box-containing protein
MIKGHKLKRLIEIGCISSDSSEERLKKSIMTIMIIPYSSAGIIWGLYFIRNGNVISGLIPLVYGIVSLTTFFHFIYTKRYNLLRFSQIAFVLVLPFFLQLSLGGFSQSSGMLLWSCTAPFIALVFYDSNVAKKWFYALIILLLLACFLDESARNYFPKEIDANAIVGVYGANFILIASLIFGIQIYFLNGMKKIKMELEEKEMLLDAATEMEKQKELLIASKQRLELVMGSLEEVVWGRNLPDYEMQYVSNSVVNLYGFPMAGWYENPNLWLDVIHPDDLAQVEKEGESLFTKGITELEYRIITADKEIKWIHSTTRIIKSSDGTPDFMTGIAKDITKLKQAELKLVASEKSYRELFEKSANAELILRNNLFIECNDAAIAMLGYKNKSALFNVPPFELSPDIQPDGQLSSEKSKVMNDIAYSTGSNRFEWYHVKSNGEVFPVEVLLTSLPSENANDKILHVVWRDITEQKKSQNQLNELNNNLEQKVNERTNELINSKLELKESLLKEQELGRLKSTFVSTASHQFRTPLTVIQSNSDLLEMLISSSGKEEGEKYKKATNRIKHEISKMTELIDEVLILGKLTSGNIHYSPEDLDLVEFCEALVKQFNSVQEDGRGIDLEIEGEARSVYLDTKLLSHSLCNLVGNAFKYSQGKRNPKLTVSFGVKELKMTIKDYGIGIPKTEVPNLFQPFFRANNATEIKGTGLGLSIAKEYVERNKGTLTVNATEGIGSSFEIKIQKYTL